MKKGYEHDRATVGQGLCAAAFVVTYRTSDFVENIGVRSSLD